MDRVGIKQKLTGVFQDVFDNPALQIDDGMTADDVAGWDSLSHINLIYATEKDFGVKFTTGEVRRLNNVGELIALIESKLA